MPKMNKLLSVFFYFMIFLVIFSKASQRFVCADDLCDEHIDDFSVCVFLSEKNHFKMRVKSKSNENQYDAQDVDR